MIMNSNIVCICMSLWLKCLLSKYVYNSYYSDLRHVITILAQCTDCKVLYFEKSVPLSCKFDAYDLNGNKAISIEEFMSATKGFTKMDRKLLFERVDRNGKISRHLHLCSSVSDRYFSIMSNTSWSFQVTISSGLASLTRTTKYFEGRNSEPVSSSSKQRLLGRLLGKMIEDVCKGTH